MIDRYPNIKLTAEASGLGPRTLQRRLAETGESYSHLVEAQRFKMASELPTRDDSRIIDIAWELSYADAANFPRALDRWTGLSPRDFRRAQSLSPGVFS